MSFKIVQTNEDGKTTPSLTVVPSAWESCGVLFWPPKRIKNANKLIRDPNSKPESDWLQYKCTRKRDNFLLYESAVSEMAAMSYNTDSDGTVYQPRKLCPKLHNPRQVVGRVPQISFNNLVEELSYLSDINNSQTVVEPPEKATKLEQLKQKDLELPTNEAHSLMPNIKILQSIPITPANNMRQRSPVEIQFPYGTPTNLLFQSNSVDPIEILEEDNNNIKSFDNSNTISNRSVQENLETIMTNQKKIIDELSKMKTMLDFVLENQAMSGNNIVLKEIPLANQNESPWKKLLPINSFEKLEEVELTLSNKKMQQILVDEKSLVCGSSGKRNGQSCCYSLVDHFFQREFLMTCSWAGGSRNVDRKISFKSYCQIINTFFQIIHLADNHFSLKDCENFFKCVIKNAKRRASNLETPKRKRASSSKNRPSNLKYKKIMLEDKENGEMEMNDSESDEMEMKIETDYDRDISNAESD